MKLSDEDKELLTADELAAYEADPDGDDEDADDAADDEGSDEGNAADESDNDTGDDGDDDDTEAKAAPASKPAADAQPAADEATEDADEDVAEAKPAAYTFNAPADITDKLTALKTEERDAFKSLMEGEMTAEDYQAIKDRTDTERETLQAQKLKAELSAEMSQQQAERDWQNACNAFAVKVKAVDGIDYEGNRVLGRALDAEVRDLAANPDNAQKPAEWFLTEAHKAVKAAMGLTAPAKPAAPTPPQRQRPNPATIPPSLSKLPAAAESPTTDDKWAHLRNLPPDKVEKAIAAMTEAELDDYMSSEA